MYDMKLHLLYEYCSNKYVSVARAANINLEPTKMSNGAGPNDLVSSEDQAFAVDASLQAFKSTKPQIDLILGKKVST